MKRRGPIAALLIMAAGAGAALVKLHHGPAVPARSAAVIDREARSAAVIDPAAAMDEVRGRDRLARGEPLAALLYFSRAYEQGDRSPALRFSIAQLLPAAQAQVAILPHPAEVLALAFSPDGALLITGSADGTARIWDGRDGHPLSPPLPHGGAVPQVAWAQPAAAGASRDGPHDGVRALTLSLDGVARLFDGDGKLLGTLSDPAGPLWLASFSPDGSRIVTAARDRRARLWDGKSGALLATLTGHAGTIWSAAFSPDGQRLCTTAADRTARLWDAARGVSLSVLRGHAADLTDAAFSPDGARLFTASADGTLRLWDGRRGALLATGPRDDADVDAGAVSSLTFTLAGGKGLLATRKNGTARIFDSFTAAPLFPPVAHPRTRQVMAVSPDGGRMVVRGADEGIELWDRLTGHVRAGLPEAAGGVTASFSRFGRRIVTSGEDGVVRLWDGRTGEPLLALPGHRGKINAAVFAPLSRANDHIGSLDGQRLASAGSDGTARLWDSAAGRPPIVLTGHAGTVRDAAFSPDGRRLLTLGADGDLRQWDGRSGQDLGVLHTRAAPLLGTFGPAGEIVAALEDGSVQTWSAAGPSQPAPGSPGSPGSILALSLNGARVASATDGGQVLLHGGSRPLTLPGHQGQVHAAAFSPDGSRLATGDDHDVRLWDTGTGALRATLSGHDGAVTALVFFPDGSRLLTGSADHTARLWDTGDGALIATLRGQGPVRSALVSPDGQRLITIDSGERSWLWDARRGQLLAALAGHAAQGRSAAAFSPDGQFLVTAGDDGLARLWSSDSGQLAFTLRHDASAIEVVRFSPDGALLYTAGRSGVGRLWDVRLESRPPAEVAKLLRCHVALRLTDDEISPAPLDPAACPAP